MNTKWTRQVKKNCCCVEEKKNIRKNFKFFFSIKVKTNILFRLKSYVQCHHLPKIILN